LGDKKKYKLGFRPIKQDLLSYNGERNTMSEETAEIDEEILEEEEEGSRDWGKVGIAMLFFLLIVIGYYVIQALS
jgi:hypothetical protein